MTSLVSYIGALRAWSALHLLWQGALIAAAYGAWKRVERPAPSIRYRATLTCLWMMVGALVMNAGLAHGALVRNATHGAEGARGAPSEWRPVMHAFDQSFGGIAALLALWAVGTSLHAARLALGQEQLRRIRASGADAPRALIERVAALAARAEMRDVPRTIVSSTRMAPFVTGGAGGLLVLPRDFAPSDELDALVLHELAHIRRGDARTQHTMHVAGMLLWWHPAVRYLAREAINAREQSCDHEVARLESPLALARALVQLEERRRSHAGAIRATDGDLALRIRRLIAHRPSDGHAMLSMRRMPWLAMLGVIAATGQAAARLAPTSDRLAVLGAEANAVSAQRMLISAQDPAGHFTITLLNGRVAGASVAGVPIAREAIVRRAQRVSLSNARGEAVVAVELDPRGAIRWEPRRVSGR